MEYIIQISVRSAEVDLQAVKEDLAMYCERFGDVAVVDILAQEIEQEKMW